MTPTDPLIRSGPYRRRLASVEAAAIAGVICAVGWALSLRGMLSAPNLEASDAEIVAYYSESSNATAALVWLQVLVFATIAFLWFVGVVRARVGDFEPRLFGTVFFGSSILLAALLFVGSALLAAPSVLVAVGDRAPDPSSAAMSRAAAAALLSVFAPRIATLVMFSTASLARVTRAFPVWLVWLTYAVGVVEFLNFSISIPSIYLVPAWIALVSIVLLVRHPPQQTEFDLSSTER